MLSSRGFVAAADGVIAVGAALALMIATPNQTARRLVFCERGREGNSRTFQMAGSAAARLEVPERKLSPQLGYRGTRHQLWLYD